MAKVEESLGLISVARGTGEADLYLDGGNLVNVLSGEIYPVNVAVFDGRIAYVGLSRKMVGSNTRVIDAGGYYLCPGLIEAHFHPWFVYNPVSIMEVALTSGTTTMLCDGLIFYINLGAERFLKMLRTLENYPLRLLWTARVMSHSPYPGEEEIFSIKNLRKIFFDPHILKVGEFTPWRTLIQGDDSLVEKINLALEAGLGIDGHTAGSSYELLNAVVAAGIGSCHEAITADEIANRLRLGLWTMLRYSSLRSDLPDLVDGITEMNLSTHRMMLTTDCSTPSFIAREGFLNRTLQIAVKKGLSPVTALQMTTLNPATYLGLDDELGSIAPGRWADLIMVKDLENFSPHLVFSRGELVAVDGKLTKSITEPDWGEIGLYSSLPSPDLVADPATYHVLGSKDEAFPVIELISGAITRRQDRFLNEREGYLEREDDLLYCALISSRSNQVTNGFISSRGLGHFEALATTLSSSLNLFVVGQDFSAMARAASKVVEMGGGIALIEKGEISYSFPLKLAGVMSTQSFAEAAAKIQEFDEKASALGYKYNDICFSLLFLTCDSLPVLRITASGIIDVKNKRIIVPGRKTKITPGGC